MTEDLTGKQGGGEAHAEQHPNYLLIWGILIGALLISLAIGAMGLPVVSAALIFTIAFVKAYIVAAYYMHLKFEPLYIVIIFLTGVLCLYFLFLGLVPDIVYAPVE